MAGKNLLGISVGEVSSVDNEDNSVRVTYEERDNYVTQPLPLALSTGWDGKPEPGDTVIVVGGFVIGVVDETEPLPENIRGMTFPDGSKIHFDLNTGKLSIDAKSGTIFTGNVNVDGDLTFNGNVTINGNLKVNGSISDSGGALPR